MSDKIIFKQPIDIQGGNNDDVLTKQNEHATWKKPSGSLPEIDKINKFAVTKNKITTINPVISNINFHKFEINTDLTTEEVNDILNQLDWSTTNRHYIFNFETSNPDAWLASGNFQIYREPIKHTYSIGFGEDWMGPTLFDNGWSSEFESIWDMYVRPETTFTSYDDCDDFYISLQKLIALKYSRELTAEWDDLARNKSKSNQTIVKGGNLLNCTPLPNSGMFKWFELNYNITSSDWNNITDILYNNLDSQNRYWIAKSEGRTSNNYFLAFEYNRNTSDYKLGIYENDNLKDWLFDTSKGRNGYNVNLNKSWNPNIIEILDNYFKNSIDIWNVNFDDPSKPQGTINSELKALIAQNYEWQNIWDYIDYSTIKNKPEIPTGDELVSEQDRINWNNKSNVSVSQTGTATEKVNFITIDGQQRKIGGEGLPEGGNEGQTIIKTNSGATWGTPTSSAIVTLYTAPTEDNTEGLKAVILDEEPETYYNGYWYFIK